MRIIAILGQDTNNIMMAYIVEAFLKRGHKVDAYGVHMLENHLYMFRNMDIAIQDVSLLNKDIVESYDLLLIYPGAFFYFPWLAGVDVYSVTYDQSYIDEPISGGDLMIERGSGWRPFLPAGRRAECAYLVVGDPKHDAENWHGVEEKKNRLLFIDSGHFPFGIEGKTAVADFLLSVCWKFPDYELMIKPRFLKGDLNVTHRNSLYLYDVLEERCHGKIPENLILLQEHVALPEMIASSHAVITMYTTAYLDVAVQGKPLIILDQLPSEDHPVQSFKRIWNPFRELVKDSGCLVDYRKALEYLPDGIKCPEDFIKRNIYTSDSVNQKIVESLEYLYENYISKGNYPALDIFYYDHLKDHDISDSSLNFQRIQELRVKNQLYQRERYFYTNSGFYPTDYRVTDYIARMDDEGKMKIEYMEDLLTGMLEQMMAYKEYMMDNAEFQEHFLTEIGLGQNYKLIFEFPREKVLNQVFYDYLYGRACYEEKRFEDAAKYLHAYIEKSQGGQYATGTHNLESYRLSGLFYCGMAELAQKKYLSAQKCFLECEKITGGTHRKAQEMLDMIEKIKKE